MKPIWLIVAALVAGCGLGYGMTWAEFNIAPSPSEWSRLTPQKPIAAPSSNGDGSAAPQPVAYLHGGGTYNFGLMETATEGSHEFVVTNRGTAPLTLTKGQASCRCTLSKLVDDKDELILAPGEETQIKTEWHTKGKVGEFRVTVSIRTNDPVTPLLELAIEGNVLQTAIVQPPELVLSSLSPTSATTADVRVFSIREDDFELQDLTLTDESTADFFDVQLSRIPADQLAVPDTRCGWLVHITVKPGLPLGTVQQKLRIQSTLKSLPEVLIPISGKVQGDINVIGRGWGDRNGALNIGLVPSDKGAERTLQLHIRGDHRNDIKVAVESVSPKFLQVSLGELEELKAGSIASMSLKITIPPGCQPCNHMGTDASASGEVILTTTHPDVKQVRVNVNFAVAR
ncbi:MAG: DUF1573 domain-containing protein [Pirellulales bacterium]